jgi:formate-dependent nitrite reductase membrane component NrfD
MEPVVLVHDKWGTDAYVPLYLFFGGLTAGVFLVAVIADLLSIKSKRLEPMARVVAYAAVVALALAGFFLTFHLGRPTRGLAFPLFFTNEESWMTRGGWIVGIGAPLVVLYAASWYFGVRPLWRRIVGIVGLPVVAMMAVYTGLLLSSAGFVALWSQRFLPILFLNSGLTTGLAAAGLILILAWPFLRDQAGLDELKTFTRWVSGGVIVLILLEMYELYSFMSYLRGGVERVAFGRVVPPKAGELAYQYVTQGELAPWFWIGVVGIGLTVPLILGVLEFALGWFQKPLFRATAATKFALVLIGGILLRFVIVWGGSLKAPLEIPLS